MEMRLSDDMQDNVSTSRQFIFDQYLTWTPFSKSVLTWQAGMSFICILFPLSDPMPDIKKVEILTHFKLTDLECGQ